MPATVDSAWVRERIICEFDHYDCCLKGLVEHEGRKLFVRIANRADVECDPDEPSVYTVHEIDWDQECDEYLADYRAAFAHWFWHDGKLPDFDGSDYSWFRQKWQGRNPIEQRLIGD